MRRIRKYRPVKNLRLKHGAFDIETWGLDARHFAFGVCVWHEDSEKHRKVFYNKEEMISFMLSRKFRGYTWWGHNAGNYDLIVLFGNYLMNRDFKVVMNKGRFIKGEYQSPSGHKIYFKDSLNFFAVKLEKLGKDIANEKLRTPDKFKIAPGDKDLIQSMLSKKKLTVADICRIFGVDEEIISNLDGLNEIQRIDAKDIEYCIRDAEIVLDAIIQLAKWSYDNFSVNIPSTIASLALRIYLTCFIHEDIIVSELDRFFRNSYYGGRVEVFTGRNKWNNIHYYDFNSLYPSVMYKERFPDPSSLTYHPFPSKSLIYEFEGVSEVSVYVPESMKIPPLPVKYDNKLIFPVGYIKGWFNHNELRMSSKYGVKILKVHKTIYSTRTTQPFKLFVEYFYNLRREYKARNNKTYDLFTKIIMNSLYGKFGQLNEFKEIGFIDEERTDEWIFEPIGLTDLGEWKKINEDGSVKTEDARHAVLSWASYITSYARCYLYEKMMEAVKCGGTVYYCDTDSIITDIELESGSQLGELKEEYRGKIYLIAPKCYILDTGDNRIMKFKGIRNPDPNGIKTKYYERRVVKVKEALRRKKEAGAGEVRIKMPKLRDEKRRWITEHDSLPLVYHQLVADKEIEKTINEEVKIMWQEIKQMKSITNIINLDGEWRRTKATVPAWYHDLENELGRKPTKEDIKEFLRYQYNMVKGSIEADIISKLRS